MVEGRVYCSEGKTGKTSRSLLLLDARSTNQLTEAWRKPGGDMRRGRKLPTAISLNAMAR